MRLETSIIRVESRGYDAVDLHSRVTEYLGEIGARGGLLYLFTRDRGVALLFIEYEPGLLTDLEDLIHRLGLDDKPWLLEGLMGKNIVIPVINGDLGTGVFKHPVLVDLSGKRGVREVLMIYEGF